MAPKHTRTKLQCRRCIALILMCGIKATEPVSGGSRRSQDIYGQPLVHPSLDKWICLGNRYVNMTPNVSMMFSLPHAPQMIPPASFLYPFYMLFRAFHAPTYSRRYLNSTLPRMNTRRYSK
ncbi:hypothetical protein BDB00DRAFT_286642 [Zychaea mexicana]|uniref:uncharacterized protein n=1 Tax=Zychaea mexicana TaxID=64656 RepID=UPI0022FE45AD|nr:uncharacterized protein BDB00DRAFT_286642 [Zychaea mexicana]KAI9494728.1 hypothetical protein BDB00DRAFT_286642 [Zychaea mexicana]